MEKQIKHILSYGGGINSSALFFYILENKMPLDLVIFSDTGVESKQTYQTVNNMMLLCLDKKIPFQKVQSSYGNLYDHYLSKKAVMSIMKRDCTSKFKISPINNHLRLRFGKQTHFNMYIGIAWEEWHRMKPSRLKYITHIYPFCDNKIDRKGNIKILEQYNFKASKSGCVGCIYNKKAEWLIMLKENPKEFAKWKLLEMSNTRYPKITINPQYALEVLERNFKEQKDLSVFLDTEKSCDAINGGCFL